MAARAALAGLLAVVLAPPAAFASSLRADVLYVLPAEAGEVAFLDLQSLRASPHYALLKQRLLPNRFAQFERFMVSLGVNVDHDLDWLAWVLVRPSPDYPAERFIGIVQGQFSPERIERHFAAREIQLSEYHNLTLYPFGGVGDATALHFTFLDSSTLAFGTQQSLELFLDTRIGARDNILRNEPLLSRISEANGRSPVWVALDEHYTRLAIQQLVPEAARFPEFRRVGERFVASLLQIDVGRDVTLEFHAWCRQPSDAEMFTLLLQAGLAAQSWQTEQTNPALGKVLSRAGVSSSGDRLELRLTAEADTLQSLLKLR